MALMAKRADKWIARISGVAKKTATVLLWQNYTKCLN